MTNNPRKAWETYDSDAASYFAAYDSLRFSKVHRQFIPYLPAKGGKILDIGCGSGRDAYALARRGYFVTAVDPSEELLSLASKKNDHPRVTWLNDHLPALSKLGSERYEFVLVSAVWMHISADQQESSLQRLAKLVTPNGYVAITLRFGPDDAEREMNEVDIELFLDKAKVQNLSPIYVSRKIRDSLGRGCVAWRKIVLQSVIG